MPGSSADVPDDLTNRERLLDGAIFLAGRHGQASVTYRAVAAHVGVTHGLVRHHFGSRENLLAEALERASRRDASELHLEADSVDDLASNLVEVLQTGGDRALLQYEAAIAAIRGQSSSDSVRRHYELYVRLVGSTLAKAGVPDDGDVLAAVVFAALDGLTLQHLLHGSPERTERALARLRALLADGPAADDPAAP